MKIVADADILDVSRSLSDLGELRLIPGREIQAQHLLDADALIVRSITRVDESLLKNSNIRFVATATSGVNHIDREYLARNNIKFADAKGSNANAVVDYFFSVLAYFVLNRKLNIENSCVGIVGGGEVGSLLATKLQRLRIPFKICDPPLEEIERDTGKGAGTAYYSLQEVMGCNIVSLHVPLTEEGEFSTANLISEPQLNLLPKNSLLVNACRGGVVDESALWQFLQDRTDVSTAFDVWENEPRPDSRLVEAVDIATPHIAGYSREAKEAATSMMRRALFAYLGKKDDSNKREGSLRKTELKLSNADECSVWQYVLRAMPIDEISAQFKSGTAAGSEIEVFDGIRAGLRDRNEYSSLALSRKQSAALPAGQLDFLQALGFGFSN